MNSTLLVGSDGIVADAGRSRRALVTVAAIVVAAAVAILWLAQQASPASAQISIGSIVCPILNALASIFTGFLAGIFTAIKAAFGC